MITKHSNITVVRSIQLAGDIIKPEDLLEVDPVEHPHMQGIVSENVPHCTLLYGLLRPGAELQKHVDAVLDGGETEDVTIDDIAIFETQQDGEACVCIVALLVVTDEPAEANARLWLPPHIDTYPDCKPHITLAYLKADSDWQAYVEPLSARLRGKADAGRAASPGMAGAWHPVDLSEGYRTESRGALRQQLRSPSAPRTYC